MTPPGRVLVLGGGLAGIAAALRLAERRVPVTLLETRKRLGGRATSFVDPRTGETIDNCQHIAMGCCTNYIDLMRRLGGLGLMRWDREQTWLEPGGRRSTIRPAPLPAPAQFSPSFAAARFLPAGSKQRVARALLSLARVRRRDWTGRTFGDWLDARGQREPERARFWDPVVISACNLAPAQTDAPVAIKVFQEGFLASARAASIGVATVPLVRLYDPAERAVREGGGTVELGASVTRFDERSATLSDGRTLEADRVICTLPWERAAKAADPGVAASDPRFAGLDALGHSPILGVHLVFDRPVLDVPHAVLVDAGTQWVFRKDAAGRRLHAVISAADDWMGLDEPAIVERVVKDLADRLPAARRAVVESFRAVKEKRATFAATPRGERARPGQLPSEPGGVLLAGCYTQTGWPATMEGAVRSGYMAAAGALGEAPGSMLVPDLPPRGFLRGAQRRWTSEEHDT